MTPSQVKSELKRSMAVVMIVSFFLISWIPSLAVATISNVRNASNSDEKINFIKTTFAILFMINSLINPLLYFWKLHKFRFSQTRNGQGTTILSPDIVTLIRLFFSCKFAVD